MKKIPLLLAVLLAAACRKPAGSASGGEPAVPTRAVVAGVPLIDYDAATGEFSCRAPGEWRALEDKTVGPRVMFFGPGSAKYPHSVSISVLRYPDGEQIRTPRDLWDALKLSGREPSPLETREIEGKPAFALHYAVAQHPLHGYKTLYMKREDVVMIPIKDGFYAISHTAPDEIYEQTMPVFEAVLASFRPKS